MWFFTNQSSSFNIERIWLWDLFVTIGSFYHRFIIGVLCLFPYYVWSPFWNSVKILVQNVHRLIFDTEELRSKANCCDVFCSQEMWLSIFFYPSRGHSITWKSSMAMQLPWSYRSKTNGRFEVKTAADFPPSSWWWRKNAVCWQLVRQIAYVCCVLSWKQLPCEVLQKQLHELGVPTSDCLRLKTESLGRWWYYWEPYPKLSSVS